MLVLSPRAVERLETYTPAWPLPKIFRLTKGGKLNEGIFEGETINTPSMLCVEDYLDALAMGEVDRRAEGARRARGRQCQGARRLGRAHAVDRSLAKNAERPLQHLGVPEGGRSGGDAALADEQAAFVKNLAGALEKEGVAYDIAYYRDAPPGLRIWCGATVETSDVEALTPWLDWAFAQCQGRAAESGVTINCHARESGHPVIASAAALARRL